VFISNNNNWLIVLRNSQRREKNFIHALAVSKFRQALEKWGDFEVIFFNLTGSIRRGHDDFYEECLI
jgi:hypothetical protein